jgi:hypothetical protein
MRALGLIFVGVFFALATFSSSRAEDADNISSFFAEPDSSHLAKVADRVMRGAAEFCPKRANGPRLSSSGEPMLCGYPIVLTHRGRLPASTNGERIRVTTGLLRDIRNDDELALILAHELSHILLGHPGRVRGEAIKQAEQAADRLGVIIVERAGYDTDRAVRIVTRVAAAGGHAYGAGGRYHLPIRRVKAMKAVIAQTTNLEAGGRTLTPAELITLASL